MDVQQPPKRRMPIGQVVAVVMVLFAALLAPVIVVYFASGGSATVMNELGHIYMLLALPLGLAIVIIGMVVSIVRHKLHGPRV